MPISQTPQQHPFPAAAIEQDSSPQRYMPMPTAEIMKRRVLFGIPLKSSLTGETVSDETLNDYITQAISEIEHSLDIYITPVTFNERHDYNRHLQFWSFGYMRLNHFPILNVKKFQFTFNNGNTQTPPLVDIPLEYLHVQSQDGTVQLVPSMGTTVSGMVMSLYSGLGFHAFNSQALSQWPGAIDITYEAGFERDKVPALIASLIENLAAHKFLSSLGPLLFPYSSVSVSIDGTSQSTGTPGPAYLQGRLADLEKAIAQQMDTAKGYYLKKFLVEMI